MRCPKCHYIGFESGERCRNCGYDFSLALDTAAAPDLAIRKEPDPAPLADLKLGERGESAPVPPRASAAPPPFDLDRIRLTPAPAGRELPLFEPPEADDKPLVMAPAVPRAPLAVRRATPEIARLRTRLRSDEGEGTAKPESSPRIVTIEQALKQPESVAQSASLGERYGSALCDLILIGTIDSAVVYLTLTMSGLTFAEIAVLPIPPLAAFLALLNGGYLFVMTAAGGQTVGKMAMRTKVVDATGAPLPLGRAAMRAFGSILSAVFAGLGFVAAAMDADRLTLHDRLARTRVITVTPEQSQAD